MNMTKDQSKKKHRRKMAQSSKRINHYKSRSNIPAGSYPKLKRKTSATWGKGAFTK